MRFANPHPPRRGAFILIALFSCLQITFGLFLFTRNGDDSARTSRAPIQLAALPTDVSALNAIEPTSNGAPSIATSEKHINDSDGNINGTFFYFREYRAKAAEKAASHQDNKQKEHIQQKSKKTIAANVLRYNPVNLPITSHNTNNTDTSENHR